MAKQNGALNKKFDQVIERLDALLGIMDSIDKTLRRHERQFEEHGKALEKHDQRLLAIEHTLEEIKTDLLERSVHYGDWVILESDAGKTRAGILRDSP
jgi:chromosome segregation ATPase